MKFEWEVLHKNCDSHGNLIDMTYRAHVYGGWLVKTINWTSDTNENERIANALVFVPDPDCRWVINDE